MAEHEREDTPFGKAEKEAQRLIEGAPELQTLLGRTSYETWQEEFNLFVKSLVRVDIQDRIPVTPLHSIDEDWYVLVKFLVNLEETFNIPWYPMRYQSSNAPWYPMRYKSGSAASLDFYLQHDEGYKIAEQSRLLILEEIAKIRAKVWQKDESCYSDLWILAKHVSRRKNIQFTEDFSWKCRQLIPILTSFLEIRYTPNTVWHRARYVDSYRESYARYINTPWMHTPWLTKSILECILDVEIEQLDVRRSQREMRNIMIGLPVLLVILSGLLYLIRPLPGMISPWNSRMHGLYWMIIGVLCIGLPFGVGLLPPMIRVLWDGAKKMRARRVMIHLREMISGHYDISEIIAWIDQQAQVNKGLHFHSLIYALLRLA